MTFLYTTLKAILCLLALVWNYLVKALRFLAGSSASSRDSEPGRISLGDDDDGSTLPLAISSSLSPSPSPSPAPTPLFTPLLLSFSPPTTRTIVASPRLFEIYQDNRFSGGSLDHLALHGPPKLANRDSLHVDTEQTKRPSVLIPRTARRPQTQSIETSRSSDAPSTRKYSRHCGQVFDFGFDPFDPANAHLDFSPGSSIISMTPPTPSILSSSPLAGPPMKRESRPLSSSQGKGLAIELNEDTNAHIFDNVVAEEDTKDRATSEGQAESKSTKGEAPVLIFVPESGDEPRDETIPTLLTTSPAFDTPTIEQTEDKGMKPDDIPFKEAQTKPSGVVSPIATISTPETTPPIKSNEIGDLAKRRCFKGGPLPTSPSRHSYLVGLPQSIKSTSIDTATPPVASPPAAPQSAPIIRNSNRSSSYFGLLTSTPSSTSASATAARIIRARNNFSTPLFHNRPPVSARKFFKNTSFMGLSINTNVNATTGLSTPSPSPSPSPRSPLASMAANLLLHSSIKPPSGDIPIPDALQELYTATDPFASSTKSFYVPNELFDLVEENPDNVDDITQSTTEDDLTTSSTKTDPNANLYDFSFYTEIGNPKPRRRSSKSSREAPTKDADKLASSTNAKASGGMKMKTTIYATYDEIAYGPECSNGGNASVTDRSRKDSRKLKPMDSLTRLRLMAESRARGEAVTSTTSTGTNSTESESRSGSLASRPDNWVGKPSSGERLPEKGETVLVVQGPLTMAIAPPCIETPKHNRTSVSSGEYDKDTLKQSGFKIIFTPPSVPGSPKSRHSRDSTSNTITGKWTLSSTSAPEPIQELEEKEDLVKEELAREKREVERKEKENVVPKTPSPRTKVKAKNRDRSQSRSKSRSRSRGGLGEGLGAKDDPTEVVAPILDDKRDDSEVDQYGQAPHKFIKPRFNRHARSTPTSPTRSSSSTTAVVAGRYPSSSRHGHGHSRFKSRSRSRSRGPDSVQGDGTPQTRTRTPAITQQSPKGNSSRSAATDTMSPPPPPAMAASRPLATSTPPPPPAPNQTPSRTWNIPRSPALSSLHYASIPPSGGVSTQNMDSDGKLQKVYRTAAAAAAAASFDMGNTSVGSTTSTLSTGSGGAGAGGLKRTTSRFGGEGRDRIKPTRPSMGTPNNGPADISGSSPSPTTLITPVGENKLRGPAADFEDTLFDSYYSSDMASPVLKVRSSTTMTPVAAGGMSVLPPSPVMEKNALGELGLTSPSPSPSPGGEDDRNASSVAPPLKLDLGTPRVFISEKMKKGHKTLKEKWSYSSLRREMRKGLGKGDGPPVVVDAPSGGGIVNPNPNPNLNPKKTRSMPLYIGTIPMVPMPMRMPTRLPVNNSFNVGTGLESVDEVDGIGMFSEEEGQEEEDRGARDRQEQPKYKLVVVNRTNETPRSSLDDEDPFSSTPDPGPLAFVAGGSAPEAPASSRRTSGGSRFADVPAGSRPESQYSGTGSATSGSSFAYMVRERTAYYEDDDDEEYREFGLSVHLDPFERLGMAVLDEELGELEGDSDGIDDILMRTGRGG